ncbi:MAG: peptide-methionine (S)-S-oxide reductase [Sphingobium sp.]|uniref:Peptide methionine sulfoxide reductase MsrA n=1 Tax=Sphingomonas bisphenolicum TaxID=296544 RepID=A0ABN5WKK4_9SPHN|nr:peptide-methionine (S)-S-oxide reductase MsrA [Sphingomonas bisphenolicum]MBA4090168.1 peptide-methionine (S)-S-oxide reductase [Sphingobium sp.]BBF72285.1 peptide methionine sulfoxide reductase MsrA [Sphingomonas bisphenolicum]
MSRIFPVAAVLLAGSALIVLTKPGAAAERAVLAPAAATTEPVTGHRETATFAGGCFWGVEGVFSHVKGVVSATSGYAGGDASTADYESVSTGTTGHAESVRVVFDPTQVNYADLLRIYFSVVADPTLLNRQGPDRGTQYRSALFPASPAQEKVARAYIAQLSAAHVYARPIVTRIEGNLRFFPAEAHHQDFMARNPTYPYIVMNDRPKVEALKRLFPTSWKA